jgi:hypothetical protein
VPGAPSACPRSARGASLAEISGNLAACAPMAGARLFSAASAPVAAEKCRPVVTVTVLSMFVAELLIRFAALVPGI